jgi:RNA polymerase sigma-70 factor (ECF subfamily)
MMELEILSQLRSGDRSRLGELIDRHGEELMRYLVAILASREMAEDMFQETWIKVMERIHRYDPQRPFGPWLFRIARNSAYDHLRRTKRRKQEPIEGEVAETGSRLELDSILAASDLTAKLLAGLSPQHRELIYLRFYEDQTYQEIAHRCHLPTGTVKSGLSRALDHLARLNEQLEAGS